LILLFITFFSFIYNFKNKSKIIFTFFSFIYNFINKSKMIDILLRYIKNNGLYLKKNQRFIYHITFSLLKTKLFCCFQRTMV
jgi:type IV secretory pathway TrbL component